MRGRIQTAAGPDRPGVIRGEDGDSYRFSLAQVRGRMALVIGTEVDFIGLGGEARDVWPMTGPAAAAGPRDLPQSLAVAAAPLPGPIRAENPFRYLFRGLTRNYFRFNGRARRAEYWSYTLLWLALIVLCYLADIVLSGLFINGGWGFPETVMPILSGILYVYSIVPGIAITVRRLHDQDMSGWLYLVNFVPYIGFLIIFILMCFDSHRRVNKHGPSPKYGAIETADIFA